MTTKLPLVVISITTAIITNVFSVAIDNDIIGEPDIECLEDEIRVWIKTRKLFAGRIYAKGRADNADCSRDDFAAAKTNKPHFDLRFGMCGMKSLRSDNQMKLMMNKFNCRLILNNSIYIQGSSSSSSKLFITKVDQAFHVKCFFEEASRGLTAELGVSMIPTTEVEARHGIPGCTYSIHRSSIDDVDAGRPAGTAIQFARVGDKVLHQWHCDDQMFGILINNCYVTDGFGKRATVIDARGCAVDPILITSIRYSSDLQRAFAESHVFKFADKPGVWFFCQIQMCMKAAGMCNGVTPPSCASTPTASIEDTFPLPDAFPSSAPQTRGTSLSYSSGVSSNNVEESNYGPTQQQPLTPFGPAVPTNRAESTIQQDTPGLRSTDNVEVTSIYETREDSRLTSPNTSDGGKTSIIDEGAYSDEDVTLPPNLTDLLSNLPEDVDANSLQKMFRDSVDDRRALIRGFEMLMTRMHSNSKSAAAASRKKKKQRRGREMMTKSMHTSNEDQSLDFSSRIAADSPTPDRPEISGQLIIFDLDEDPPSHLQLSRSEYADDDSASSTIQDVTASSVCIISRQGLAILTLLLSFTGALLLLAVIILYVRLSNNRSQLYRNMTTSCDSSSRSAAVDKTCSTTTTSPYPRAVASRR